MDLSLARTEADLETRALLARLGGVDSGPHGGAMANCLATAQQALHACAPGPLLDKLAAELAQLAHHCRRDQEALEAQFGPLALATQGVPAELQSARRVALATRELSELARLKALNRG
jgi:hypothetical protein